MSEKKRILVVDDEPDFAAIVQKNLEKEGFSVEVAYDDVVDAFNARYRGADWDGLIATEPPLIRTETLAHFAAAGDLALVTGRQEPEARWTLERFG